MFDQKEGRIVLTNKNMFDQKEGRIVLTQKNMFDQKEGLSLIHISEPTIPP